MFLGRFIPSSSTQIAISIYIASDTWWRNAAISLLTSHETQKPPCFLTLLYRHLARVHISICTQGSKSQCNVNCGEGFGLLKYTMLHSGLQEQEQQQHSNT
jgi:hypothetical protein